MVSFVEAEAQLWADVIMSSGPQILGSIQDGRLLALGIGSYLDFFSSLLYHALIETSTQNTDDAP